MYQSGTRKVFLETVIVGSTVWTYTLRSSARAPIGIADAICCDGVLRDASAPTNFTRSSLAIG
jgi:hypothetical protein